MPEEMRNIESTCRLMLFDQFAALENAPKIDFSAIKTNVQGGKAKFEVNAVAMKSMFETSLALDGKLANDIMLMWV